jgi:hypothetical protein
MKTPSEVLLELVQADAEVANALIDWNDFKVVETIDFFESEEKDLPAPLTEMELKLLSARVGLHLAQEDADEETKGTTQSSTAPSTEQPAGPAQEEQLPASDDPNIKVYKNYTRTAGTATAPKTATTQLCPRCGMQVPLSEMAEHMRIELLDPRWREQKEHVIRQADNTLVQGVDISKNLQQLAKRRRDIFGEDEEMLVNPLETYKKKHELQQHQPHVRPEESREELLKVTCLPFCISDFSVCRIASEPNGVRCRNGNDGHAPASWSNPLPSTANAYAWHDAAGHGDGHDAQPWDGNAADGCPTSNGNSPTPSKSSAGATATAPSGRSCPSLSTSRCSCPSPTVTATQSAPASSRNAALAHSGPAAPGTLSSGSSCHNPSCIANAFVSCTAPPNATPNATRFWIPTHGADASVTVASLGARCQASAHRGKFNSRSGVQATSSSSDQISVI